MSRFRLGEFRFAEVVRAVCGVGAGHNAPRNGDGCCRNFGHLNFATGTRTRIAYGKHLIRSKGSFGVTAGLG